MMACFLDTGVDVDVSDVITCSCEAKEDTSEIVAVEFCTPVATALNTDPRAK